MKRFVDYKDLDNWVFGVDGTPTVEIWELDEWYAQYHRQSGLARLAPKSDDLTPTRYGSWKEARANMFPAGLIDH